MGDLFFQYCRIPKSWVHGSIAGDMNWEMGNFRWNETFNREARMSHIFADIFYEPDSMVISRWNKAHELFIIMNIYDLIRFSNIFKYRTTQNILRGIQNLLMLFSINLETNRMNLKRVSRLTTERNGTA